MRYNLRVNNKEMTKFNVYVESSDILYNKYRVQLLKALNSYGISIWNI